MAGAMIDVAVVGPEAAAEVVDVVHASFGAREVLDPPSTAPSETRESVAAYWVTEIPHPTVWRMTSTVRMPEAPVAGDDDLEIRVRQEVEAGRAVPV